jgi:hypothetical protein
MKEKYYINWSVHTNRYKVYKQDSSEVCIAVFDTKREAENFIKINK